MIELKKDFNIFAIILFFGLVIRLATAYFNNGYLALDDYYILFFSVPAQAGTLPLLDKIQFVPEIRSLLPDLLIRLFADTAFYLGFVDPLYQIQFIFAGLGLLSISNIVIAYKYLKFLNVGITFEKAPYLRYMPIIGAFILSFHFLMPFVSTRALIESISSPFILGSLFSISLFLKSGSYKQLGLAVLFITIASMIRFQAGICAVALSLLVINKSIQEKNIKDTLCLFVFAMIFFVISGLLDFFLRGKFHSSLFAYIIYNLNHSSEYGTSPWYTYIPIILGASFFPFIIERYENFDWKGLYNKFFPALVFSFLFLIFHSLTPHKEERFLLPVLPVFLILLTPFYSYIFHKPVRNFSIRLLIILIINFLLLISLSFFNIQNNVIGLVRYLHNHAEIKELYIYKDSIPYLPVSYAYREPLEKIVVIDDLESLLRERKIDDGTGFYCKMSFVFRKDYLSEELKGLASLKLNQVFKSSPIEEFAVSLNPKKNKRRTSLYLFKHEECD